MMDNFGFMKTESTNQLPINQESSNSDDLDQQNNDNGDDKDSSLKLKNELTNVKNYKTITDRSLSIDSKKSIDTNWSSYDSVEKTSFLLKSILKIILFFVLLYLFLFSLNFMSIGFTLISGYAVRASDIIKLLLSNPFAALAIGVIVTALIQNATAITSVVVSMVGAGIIKDVNLAIPIIVNDFKLL